MTERSFPTRSHSSYGCLHCTYTRLVMSTPIMYQAGVRGPYCPLLNYWQLMDCRGRTVIDFSFILSSTPDSEKEYFQTHSHKVHTGWKKSKDENQTKTMHKFRKGICRGEGLQLGWNGDKRWEYEQSDDTRHNQGDRAVDRRWVNNGLYALWNSQITNLINKRIIVELKSRTLTCMFLWWLVWYQCDTS